MIRCQVHPELNPQEGTWTNEHLPSCISAIAEEYAEVVKDPPGHYVL